APYRGSKPARWLPSDIVEEIAALYRRCDKSHFTALLGQTGLDLSAKDLLRFADSLSDRRLDRRELIDLRRNVLRALAPFRPHRSMPDWIRRGQRAFFETRWAKLICS